MFKSLVRRATLAALLPLSLTAATTVVPLDSDWRFLKGLTEASTPDLADWRARNFDDSSWPTLPAPFWYGDVQSSPGTELTDMFGGYSCVFMRRTFVLANAAGISTVELGAQSDDGFVAWVNGHEVARFNMPQGDPTFDSFSLPALGEPIPFELFPNTDPGTFLVDGTNVLAVQAFNSSLANSSDFVINVSLSTAEDVDPPVVDTLIPPANAILRNLTSVEVAFSEAVTNVDAADLLINNQAATGVTVLTASQYLFSFTQPPTGTVSLAWSSGHGIQDLASTAHPFAGGNWSYTLDPSLPPPGVLINEFMADNEDSLNDEDGDSSDWIELLNAGTTAVDITGWHLTDDTNNLVRWRFPSVTLPSGAYLVVFASGKNRTNPAAQLHTDFNLEKRGGFLALTDRDGLIVSEFRFYPAQQRDVSYGRDQISPTTLGYFPQPTPRAANSTGGPGFSPPVSFSRPGGTFTAPFNLTLNTTEPTAVIRYTLDGSAPTASSTVYSAPIAITNSVLVRARAFQTGLLPGEARSEGFVLLSASLVNFTSDLPLLIIHNFGRGAVPASEDQPAFLTLFEPTANGISSLTNTPEIHSRAGINIRGRSTESYPKRSFAVEWWNEADDDKDLEVLGLPSQSDWVLYAPNNFEPVLFHNPYAHKLSRQIGRYSPRTRFVEVYLNTAGGPLLAGNYNGIYVLLEKIKRDNNRVDIDNLEPEHLTPPKLTGGYLLKIDSQDADEFSFFAAGQGIIYQDPPGLELIQPQRAPQAQYITDYFDAFYNALYASDWTNALTGYRAYLDIDAAIDHHLLNVLTFNVDALRLSGFFHKPRNGKITFGPLWDFDRALNSTDGRDANPRVWRAQSGDQGTDFFNYPWWDRMFQDPDFWQRYVDRYQELRQSWFAITNLHGLADDFASEVRQAQPREQARWNVTPRGGYQGEVNILKNWLASRVNFMDTNFLNPPALSAPGGPITSGYQLTISPATKAGSWVVYTLNGTDPRAPGGNPAPNAISNLGPVTISLPANARVVARSLNPNHANLTGFNNPPISTPWSGPTAATYFVTRPTLAVAEIMYHPPAPPANNTNDADAFEYVELRNTGSSTLNLRGASLAGGVEFTFPTDYSLNPGDRVLIVSDLAAFQSRYGTSLPVAGTYTGRLANDGDHLVLLGPLQEPLLDFRFRDDWYPITDGAGFSLVAVDESALNPSWSTPTQWRPSGLPNGSPGLDDPTPPTFPNVVINEALTHTDPPQVDTIELFNPSSSPANIGGWWITDDFEAPFKFRISPGTSIDAGGFLTYAESSFTNATVPFLISSLGDQLYLFSADAATNLTGYVHGFRFGAAQNGVAFGRHTDSLSREHFVAQLTNSLANPNPGPLVGPVVIHELMYDPATAYLTNNNTRDEFIELRNVTSQPTPLFDPNAVTNTWYLDGAVHFELPQNITLPPNGYLLVVGFDPALRPVDLEAFRAVYQLDTSVQIVGPYLGNLDNNGERLQLLKPDPPEVLPGPSFGFVPYVLVDEINYGNTAPWPTNANATGRSLQRLGPRLFGDDPANWTTAIATPGRTNAVPPLGDNDGDGLPDDWELTYNLRTDSATGDDGALGDPDHDGLTNLQEYLSGTHPRDPASYLRVDAIDSIAPEVQLRFHGVAGHSYSIVYRLAVEPTSDPWLILTNLSTRTVDGDVTTLDLPPQNQPQRIYRLVTPSLP